MSGSNFQRVSAFLGLGFGTSIDGDMVFVLLLD